MLAVVLLVVLFSGVELPQGASAQYVKKLKKCPVDGPEIWYDDVRCIKYSCVNGYVATSSCGRRLSRPLPKRCKYVKGTGRFPECCTKVMCSESGFNKRFLNGNGRISQLRGRQASEEAEPAFAQQRRSMQDASARAPSVLQGRALATPPNNTGPGFENIVPLMFPHIG
ncbi:unnamed protein product [Ixodes persulcatus]